MKRILAAHRFFWQKSPQYVGAATPLEYLRAYRRFMYYTLKETA